MMHLDEILSAPWYRGQLLELEPSSAALADYGSLSTADEAITGFFSDVCGALGFEGLYRHQASAIDAWALCQNVLLATDAGSGRRTTLLLLAFANILLKGSVSLLILPDGGLAETTYQMATSISDSLLLNLIVSPRYCQTKEELVGATSRGSGLLITTAKAFFGLVRSTADAHTLAFWLHGLGFCGVHAATLFTPPELAHVKLLLRIIQSHAKESRFAVSALRMDSPEQFSASVLGDARKVRIITEETSAKSAYHIAMWFPALKANPAKISGEYVVKRDHLVDDAIRLTVNICRERNVAAAAIWNGIGLQDVALERKIRDGISKHLDTQLSTGSWHPPKLFQWRTPENSTVSDSVGLDLLVLLGLPGNLRSVRRQIANLLRDSGIAVILIADDPVTFSQFRRDSIQNHVPLQQRYLVPTSAFLEDQYLTMMLRLNVGSELLAEDVHRICARGDFIKSLETDGILQSISEKRWFVLKAPAVAQVEWPQLESEVLSFTKQQGTKEVRIDKYRLPFTVHHGGVLRLQEEVFRIDTSAHVLQQAAEDHPIATIPSIEVKLTGTSVVKEKAISLAGECQGIKYVSCALDVVEKGYYALSDFSSINERQLFHAPAREHERRETFALMLDCDVGCEAESALLLWQYLRLLYGNLEEMVAILPEIGKVVIAAISPAFRVVLEDYYDCFDLQHTHFLTFAYQLLEGCPCLTGCPRCLYHPLRRQRFKGSKELIMRSLSRLLEVRTFAEDWEYKSRGLAPSEARTRYEVEKCRILKLFRERFGIRIETEVPIKAVPLPESGLVGIYKDSSVEVKAPVKESRAIVIIAHEYAHNWEFDPAGNNLNLLLRGSDIPHDGKLVSEGFAQWISFKICDHLSLVDEAEGIKLWVDDEYGEGFNFINWIEREVCGYCGVIEFVTNGYVRDQRGNQRFFPELYKDFSTRL